MSLDPEAIIMLSSFCETLGYNNGIWEFNFGFNTNSLNLALNVNAKIHHQLMCIGGVSKTNFNFLKSSDDTLMMLATMKGLIASGNKLENIKNEYIKSIPELQNKIRGTGIVTLENLEKLKKNIKIEYNQKYGGNGATIRAIPIGIFYWNNIDELIKVSTRVGQLTHNYILGVFGSMISALFTSFAIQKIMPWKWVSKLLDLLLSDKINQIIKELDDYEKYEKDLDIIINIFADYQEKRVDKIFYSNDMFKFELNRWEFLLRYSPQINNKPEKDFSKFGSNGIDVIIIALDALLSALLSDKAQKDINVDVDEIDIGWESLVYFSSLHFGDNDSTGALAGAWYGALKGYKDTFGRFETLEFYDEIKKLSKNLRIITST